VRERCRAVAACAVYRCRLCVTGAMRIRPPGVVPFGVCASRVARHARVALHAIVFFAHAHARGPDCYAKSVRETPPVVVLRGHRAAVPLRVRLRRLRQRRPVVAVPAAPRAARRFANRRFATRQGVLTRRRGRATGEAIRGPPAVAGHRAATATGTRDVVVFHANPSHDGKHPRRQRERDERERKLATPKPAARVSGGSHRDRGSVLTGNATTAATAQTNPHAASDAAAQ
jgi:hypothetical protein